MNTLQASSTALTKISIQFHFMCFVLNMVFLYVLYFDMFFYLFSRIKFNQYGGIHRIPNSQSEAGTLENLCAITPPEGC